MEITPQEALDCFASDDLIGIGMEADSVRRALHPENVVTYAAARTVALDLHPDDLFAAVEVCALAGDTTICFTDLHTFSLAQVEATLAAVRQGFPRLGIHALSIGDVVSLAQSSGLGLHQILASLRAAGLDSVAGDDLSTLPAANGHVGIGAWLEVHRSAHRAGIASSAGLVFGLGESNEDRVDALFALRALQTETGGFTAFTLIAPKPAAHLEPPTAVEYLRTLAIARIVLDNVPSIESSCVAHGLKVVQMALRFGANDAGSIASAPPAKAGFTEEDLRRVIRDAGFTPVERDPLYRTLFLNN